jgi:CDP-diacylglycerol--inositol 3-phosphatidyltransferase
MWDGKAARYFNQTTNFGAMLDMVTDRCSGVGLGVMIARRRPELTMLCHIFIWIDICSHWAHMLVEARTGSRSHKNVEGGLLGFYYRTGWFMVLLIFGAEGFPCLLYARDFGPLSIPLLDWIAWFLEIVAFPLFLLKHSINVIQFIRAAVNLDLQPKAE